MTEQSNAWTPSIKLPEGSRWDTDKDGLLCVVTHESYGDVTTPCIANRTYRDVNAALVAAYDEHIAVVAKYNEECAKKAREANKFVPHMCGMDMERLDTHQCWRLKTCGHEYFLREKFHPWVSYLGGSDCAPVDLAPTEDDVKSGYQRQLQWLIWRAYEHCAEFMGLTGFSGDSYKLTWLRTQFAENTTVKELAGQLGLGVDTSSASGSISRDMRANALLVEIHKLEEEKAQLLKQVAEGTAVRPLVNIEPDHQKQVSFLRNKVNTLSKDHEALTERGLKDVKSGRIKFVAEDVEGVERRPVLHCPVAERHAATPMEQLSMRHLLRILSATLADPNDGVCKEARSYAVTFSETFYEDDLKIVPKKKVWVDDVLVGELFVW